MPRARIIAIISHIYPPFIFLTYLNNISFYYFK